MKKILIALAMLFAFNAVQAADKGDWKNWYSIMLKSLRAKVEKKLESKNRVSSVAAVRGELQDNNPRAIYWKGGVSEAARKKLEAERKQLAEAVQLVVDGKVPEGRAAIGKFISENPESVYLDDAKEALGRLPPAEAPAPAESGKTAPEKQADDGGKSEPGN